MKLQLWRRITTQKIHLVKAEIFKQLLSKLYTTCHLSITKSYRSFHYFIYLRWWLPYQLCVFHLEDNFIKHGENESTIWSTSSSLQWWQHYTFISCTILFTSHYKRTDTLICQQLTTWLTASLLPQVISASVYIFCAMQLIWNFHFHLLYSLHVTTHIWIWVCNFCFLCVSLWDSSTDMASTSPL